MKQRPCLTFPWPWQIKLGSSVWEKSPENHQVAPVERCPCFYLPLNAYFYSLMQPLKMNNKKNSKKKKKKHNIFTLPLFLTVFFPFETWKSFQMFKVSLHLLKNLTPGNWHNPGEKEALLHQNCHSPEGLGDTVIRTELETVTHLKDSTSEEEMSTVSAHVKCTQLNSIIFLVTTKLLKFN